MNIVYCNYVTPIFLSLFKSCSSRLIGKDKESHLIPLLLDILYEQSNLHGPLHLPPNGGDPGLVAKQWVHGDTVLNDQCSYRDERKDQHVQDKEFLSCSSGGVDLITTNTPGSVFQPLFNDKIFKKVLYISTPTWAVAMLDMASSASSFILLIYCFSFPVWLCWLWLSWSAPSQPAMTGWCAASQQQQQVLYTYTQPRGVRIRIYLFELSNKIWDNIFLFWS